MTQNHRFVIFDILDNDPAARAMAEGDETTASGDWSRSRRSTESAVMYGLLIYADCCPVLTTSLHAPLKGMDDAGCRSNGLPVPICPR